MKTQSIEHADLNSPSVNRPSHDGRLEIDKVVTPHLEERFRHMVDSGKQMVETGKERANAWKSGLQDGIREKPLQYVLIAAAAGAVLGLILGRRRAV